ncbi:DUF1801 domain-containing protein [Flavitalea sp.]|nr:DUF1801 domain-containing protein [Flavitalea sp.]
MAKSKDINTPEQVTAFIKKLEPGLAEVVQAVREVILSVDPSIGEQIKWNSPSFFYTGEMKAFDPKDYKSDLVVVNVHRGNALLVFPTGAIIKDKSGVLEGDYKDGRRVVNIKDIKDLADKKKSLQLVIREWLKMIE